MSVHRSRTDSPTRIGLFSWFGRISSFLSAVWSGRAFFYVLLGATVAGGQANASESVGIAIEILPPTVEVAEEEPVGAIVAPVSEAETVYRAAMEAGSQRDFVRARELLEKTLRLQPDYLSADLTLGVVLGILNESEAGRARLERISNLSVPLAVDAHVLLANQASKEGRYEDTAKHYAQAIKISPENVGLHVKLGMSLIAQSRAEEAVPVLEAAIALRPKTSKAWLNLGRAFLSLDRSSEAELCFQRVRELDKRNLFATWYLARLVAERDQKEEANALYEEAAKWAAERRQLELVVQIRAEQKSL